MQRRQTGGSGGGGETYIEVAEHGGDDVAALVSDGRAGAALAERVVDSHLVVVGRHGRRATAQAWHVLAESRVWQQQAAAVSSRDTRGRKSARKYHSGWKAKVINCSLS